MSNLPTLDTLIKKGAGVKGKRVLVRVDLNVPMEHGKVTDDTRIVRVAPTVNKLVKEKAKVILISHFGRPKGEFDFSLSLAPIADTVSKALKGKEVKFALDCIGHDAEEAVDALKPGEVLLLENLRFHEGEMKNTAAFTKSLASLGDAYVNDAFACSHRAHASIVGLAKALPSAVGTLFEKEVECLEKILDKPKKPLAAIVGGAKVSTKIDLLEKLVTKVDKLIIGGGMANTFLYAQGHAVGKSLCEKDLKKTATTIMQHAKKHGCEIILPSDVVVAKKLEEKADCEIVAIKDVPKDSMMLDIGPESVQTITEHLSKCKTLVWNGPMGAFEVSPFDVGTISLSRSIAALTSSGKVTSIAGGGDILSALCKSGLKDKFSYVSTAGGAFLEWLEGKTLPGVKALLK